MEWISAAVEIQHRFQTDLLDVMNSELKNRPTHTQVNYHTHVKPSLRFCVKWDRMLDKWSLKWINAALKYHTKDWQKIYKETKSNNKTLRKIKFKNLNNNNSPKLLTLLNPPWKLVLNKNNHHQSLRFLLTTLMLINYLQQYSDNGAIKLHNLVKNKRA